MPPEEAKRLDGADFPEVATHDRLYRAQRALAAHDRAASGEAPVFEGSGPPAPPSLAARHPFDMAMKMKVENVTARKHAPQMNLVLVSSKSGRRE